MSELGSSLPSGVTVKVTGVSLPFRGQDSTGQYQQGRNVTYQLSTGQAGQIFVPDSQLSPDTVKQLVMTDAQNLNAISSIVL